MHRYKTIGDLFKKEPIQWGLRGDPYLWMEMGEYFSTVQIPSSVSDLEKEIERAFLLFTGKTLSHRENFFVEKYAHGGMSSGGISPEFWRNQAIPLLIERYNER